MRPFERIGTGPTARFESHVDGPFVGALARLCDQISSQLTARTDPSGPGWEPAPEAEAGGPPASAEPHDEAAGPLGLDPADPLARLNPPASRFDRQRAEEFRRLTQGDLDLARVERLQWLAALLRRSKTSALRAARVSVEAQDAPRLAATLNDLRLVLAQRLGIADADDAEHLYQRAFEPGPGSIDAMLYLAAGVLQESLLDAMTAD